jgi:hypothetical protein
MSMRSVGVNGGLPVFSGFFTTDSTAQVAIAGTIDVTNIIAIRCEADFSYNIAGAGTIVTVPAGEVIAFGSAVTSITNQTGTTIDYEIMSA